MFTDKQEKLRILIIEDEPIIALDLQDSLVEAGFDVVGIAGRLAVALTLIDETAFEVAIVDANLAGESASPAAAVLVARHIPFVVLSGYSFEQQQEAFAGAIFIQKPCRTNLLIETLNSIVPSL